MAIAFGLVAASMATTFDSVLAFDLDCSSNSQSCHRFEIARKDLPPDSPSAADLDSA